MSIGTVSIDFENDVEPGFIFSLDIQVNGLPLTDAEYNDIANHILTFNTVQNYFSSTAPRVESITAEETRSITVI